MRGQPILPSVSVPPFLRPPAGITSDIVSTDRGDFAVLDNREALAGRGHGKGHGSALLVPGFTGSKEDFIAVLSPLAARGVRAVALDLAGQYESARPAPDAEFSLAGFAADVAAAAAAVEPPVVLVGHSFGGLVVREAMLANPHRAVGLALVASGPAALPGDQQAVLQRFADALRAHGLAAVWQAKQALDAATGVPAPPPEIADFLTRRFLAHDPRSLLAMIETLTSAQDRVTALAETLDETGIATVVVIGGQDDVWPLGQQRDLAERLGARVVELAEAGHSPAVDDPTATADAIASLVT